MEHIFISVVKNEYGLKISFCVLQRYHNTDSSLKIYFNFTFHTIGKSQSNICDKNKGAWAG